MEQLETFLDADVDQSLTSRHIEGAVSFRPVGMRLAAMNTYYAVLTVNREELVLSVPLFGTYIFKPEHIKAIAVPDHDDNALCISHTLEAYPEVILFYPKLFEYADEVLPVITKLGFHPKAPEEQLPQRATGSPLRLWLLTLVLLATMGGFYGAVWYYEVLWLRPVMYLIPGTVCLGLWWSVPRWRWMQRLWLKRGRHPGEVVPTVFELAMKFFVFFIVYWTVFRVFLQ